MSHYSDSLLLGKQTPVVETYSPNLLFPIPRAQGRAGLASETHFHGADLWHAYEVSWLNAQGKPEVRVARFTVPCNSPNMVESKSFKLYLNSVNTTRYPSEQHLLETLQRDISAVAGADVAIELLPVTDPSLDGQTPPGHCIDGLSIDADTASPDAAMLQVYGSEVEESLHSHLLRSLCPVTGQPDWASVWVHYKGRTLDHASLLRYIVSFRQHQEFHEQCVERMFGDIASVLQPEILHVQAFYTRRGGMDINPLRSTDASLRPQRRMNRQ